MPLEGGSLSKALMLSLTSLEKLSFVKGITGPLVESFLTSGDNEMYHCEGFWQAELERQRTCYCKSSTIPSVANMEIRHLDRRQRLHAQ